jgi:hypothetical protein
MFSFMAAEDFSFASSDFLAVELPQKVMRANAGRMTDERFFVNVSFEPSLISRSACVNARLAM